jgi:SNF2 family DNA or RNA helicase
MGSGLLFSGAFFLACIGLIENNSERQKEISHFQDDSENMLFLISLRAGGGGP